MLCWISIFGGLLIMMGQHDRSEVLFYYFRLEDQVPETHLLRLIDKHISFEFVRQQLKDSYIYGVMFRSANHCKNSPFPYVVSAATDSGARPCHSAKRVSMSCAATVS